MFVVGNLFTVLAGVVHVLFQFAWWILMARIVLSWLNPEPQNDFLRQAIRAIYALTDPVLSRIRRAAPFLVVGGLDLSTLVLLVGLGAADQFLSGTLSQLGHRLS